MNSRNKNSFYSKFIWTITIGSAAYIFVQLIPFIGWFMAYWYTVVIVLLIIGVVTGVCLNLLSIPRAFGTAYLGVGLSYGIKNILVPTFQAQSTYSVPFLILSSLIGFMLAGILSYKVKNYKIFWTIVIVIFAASIYSPYPAALIDHYTYTHFYEFN